MPGILHDYVAHGQALASAHRRPLVVLGALATVAAIGGLLQWLWRAKRTKGRAGPSGRGRVRSSNSNQPSRSTAPGPGVDFIPISHGQETLLLAGVEALNESIKNWQQAVNIGVLKGQHGALMENLEILLDKSEALSEDFVRFLAEYGSNSAGGRLFKAPVAGEVRFAPAVPESASMLSFRKTLSILSDDSFLSALDDLPVPSFPEVDVINRPALDIPLEELVAYSCGVKEVRAGNVQCRVFRTEAVKCLTDDEYLAKLYCLRKAFERIFEDEFQREWMAAQGKALLVAIMQRSNKPIADLQVAYDKLLDFACNPDNWATIEAELKSRNVPQLSFYDVLMDFILLDAFEDLSKPPAAVLAVAQNRFLTSSFKETVPQLSFYDVLMDFILLDAFEDLSKPPAAVLAVAQNRCLTSSFKESFGGRVLFILLDAFEDLSKPPAAVLAVAQNRCLTSSFKESTLQTVVWSVLKGKRSRLKLPNGFIAHFYDVSEQISPTLAWGFLGTDEELRELCYFFKDQICGFLTDIFNFERVNYTTFDDLAKDVWLIMKGRVILTCEHLSFD